MHWPRRLFISQKTAFFGLDITASTLKLLELVYLEDTYCVKRFGQLPLVPDVMNGTQVQDVEGLATHIRQLLIDQGYWPPTKLLLNAVIAVPDACTIRKTITVSDRLDDRDLEALVHLELEKIIPNAMGAREDICFDFKRLGPIASQTTLKELLIVATRKEHVQQRVTALRQLGVRTHVVDIESFAIQRALSLILTTDETAGITLFLEIEAQSLKVLFFKQGHLIHLREELFEHTVLSSGMLMESAHCDALWMCIKRACHFFYSAYPQKEAIMQALLGGEGAKHIDLLLFLQQQLGVAIRVANPFQHLRIEDYHREQLLQDAASYMTACGLAQRAR